MSEGHVRQARKASEALEVFVVGDLQKIEKEASGRSKEVKAVRQACKDFLDAEKAGSGFSGQGVSANAGGSVHRTASGSSGMLATDKASAVLDPLLLACATGQQKLVEPALGCLHKLIAHAYLQGESGEEGRLDEGSTVVKVVGAVAKCGESRVESVQLAVIRALLTAATSDAFVLHGEVLLQSVRAVYNLALSSESESIRNTARSALTQVISMLLKRMQQHALFSDVEGDDEGGHPPSPASAAPDTPARDGDGGHDAVGGDGGEAAPAPEGAGGAEEGAMEGEAAGEGESQGAAGAPEPSSVPPPAEGAAGGEAPPPHLGVLERDALNVVRSLRKLAMQEEDGLKGQPVLLRGKLLAMDLLREMLASNGPAWEAASADFVAVLRKHVCAALIRNALSPLPAVFQLNANILGAIILQRPLRAAFKPELATFYPKIVLQPLEDRASPAGGAHQAVVLRLLKRMCSEPALLVDMYVNYDCELHAPNLFGRTVEVLASFAEKPGAGGGRVGEGAPSPPALRWASLQCLASLLGSLAEWAGELGEVEVPPAPGAAAPPRATLSGAATPEAKGSYGDLASVAGGPGAGAGAGPGPAAGAGVGADAVVGAGAGAGAAPPPEEVERLRHQKTRKEELAGAVALFNAKPLKGVTALVQLGAIEDTHEGIARWLLETRGLSKVMIGEFLGGHEDRELGVMHKYVDLFEFAGMEIDAALRLFLRGFRLPGEAQKIDRLMEKFAARYCESNKEVFKSADAAYVLAFAVIMLNTDAHSRQITEKMSCDNFVSMNQAATQDEDIPRELLEAIYGRIVEDEIKLVGQDGEPAGRAGGSGGGSGGGEGGGDAAAVLVETVLNVAMPWRKASALARAAEERKADMRAFQQGLRQAIGGGDDGAPRVPYHRATHPSHAAPMLEESGVAALGALKVGLSNIDDAVRVAAMVEGVVQVVRLACALQLDELRDEALRALTSAAGGPLATSRACHVAALQAVLGLAAAEGHLLTGSAWGEVLTCVSSLEVLRMRSSGVASDGEFFPDEAAHPEEAKVKESASPFRQLGALFKKGITAAPGLRGAGGDGGAGDAGGGKDGRAGGSGRERAAGGATGAWLQSEGEQALQRVFVCSARLDSDAVVQFFEALCKVSHDELQVLPPEGPRVFCLSKLVECAHDNLGRIRLVWQRLWAVVSSHLVAAACHPNTNVALYAVDSLRQLATKLLERCELANFAFQSDALRPFVSIMARSGGADKVRELVVRCAAQAAAARGPALHSGWSSVFMVFAAAASDPSASLVAPALDATEDAIPMLFGAIGGDCFADCINCLGHVVHNPRHEWHALRALAALRLCGARLAEAHAGQVEVAVPAAGGGGGRDAEAAAGLLELSEHHWVPLLAGLGEQLHDGRDAVRGAALELLFELMHAYGDSWSPPLWRRVYERVLEPLMDPVRAAGARESEDGAGGPVGEGGRAAEQYLLGASRAYMPRLCELFAKFYPVMEDLLPRLLAVLLRCMASRNQTLAVEGVAAVRKVGDCLGGTLGPVGWDAVLRTFREASEAARPFPEEGAEELGLDELGVRTRCVVGLMVQRALGEVLQAHAHHHLSSGQRAHALDTLKRSILAAADLNADARRRGELQSVLRGGAEGWADASLPPLPGGEPGLGGSGADGGGLPGLLRQEVEGCGVYLTAALRALGGPGGDHDPEIISRLVWLCSHVVARCATCVEGPSPAAPVPPGAWPAVPEGDIGVRLALAGLGVEGEWQAGGGGEDGGGGATVGWVEARREMTIRAPLLVVVLQLLTRLEGGGMDSTLVALFPHLAALICAEPLSVRHALRELFTTRMRLFLKVASREQKGEGED